MRPEIDAFEAWRATRRAVASAVPLTPDWFRLRAIEHDLRTLYEGLSASSSRSERAPASSIGAITPAEVRSR